MLELKSSMIKQYSFVEFVICLGGCFTIATMAIFMSFRIMKETKKPDHDRRYSTRRAGTCPKTKKIHKLIIKVIMINHID